MAIENLTTYTEVDSAGDLTITSASAAFDTMPRQVVSYVYKDFGASYFSDFDIDFEFQITAISTTGIATVFSLSNTIGTFQDQLTANDGLIVVVYGNTSNFQIQIRDENTDTTDLYTYGGTSTPILYCTAKRNSTTFTLDVYSDSGRTALLDTLSISCETGAKRYLSVVQSRDAGSGDSITGYSQNYEIQFASSSSLSSSSLSSSSSSSSSSLSSSSSSTSSSSSSSSSSISSSSLSSSSLSSSSLSSSSSSSSLSSSSSSSSTSMTVPSLKHFWYTLRDTAGEPREGETVYAYEATSTASSTVSTLLHLYDFRGRPIANPMTTSTGTSAGVSAGIIEFAYPAPPLSPQ